MVPYRRTLPSPQIGPLVDLVPQRTHLTSSPGLGLINDSCHGLLLSAPCHKDGCMDVIPNLHSQRDGTGDPVMARQHFLSLRN